MVGTNRRTGKAGETTPHSDKPKVPPQAAQQVGGAMSDTLMSMSVELKEGMKKVVVPTAFMLLMQDFAQGDYGDLTPELFAQFSEGMLAPFEAQHRALLEGRVLMPTPQLALPVSSGEQIGSSSST
ncbi:MAG: hypothetical protein RMX65_002045 [Nostoc sp. DedQUE01]